MAEQITIIKEHIYFVVAAYTVLWAVLIVYVGLVMRRLARIEQQMSIVEEAAERRV